MTYWPISHMRPVKPSAHWQVKAAIPSMQVPLFKHGLVAQSSISAKSRKNSIFYLKPLISFILELGVLPIRCRIFSELFHVIRWFYESVWCYVNKDDCDEMTHTIPLIKPRLLYQPEDLKWQIWESRADMVVEGWNRVRYKDCHLIIYLSYIFIVIKLPVYQSIYGVSRWDEFRLPS